MNFFVRKFCNFFTFNFCYYLISMFFLLLKQLSNKKKIVFQEGVYKKNLNLVGGYSCWGGGSSKNLFKGGRAVSKGVERLSERVGISKDTMRALSCM